MLNLAQRSRDDRSAIFTNTSFELGLSNAVVEKDFWVCWLLEVIFKHSEYTSDFSFKGGTSLSKGYGLIKRFSEDIDLILDWRVLGYQRDEPWEQRSKTQQSRFNDEMCQRTEKFLSDVLMPHLEVLVSSLGVSEGKFYIDEQDRSTIRFVYPQIFVDAALVQEVRLEIGALAAWTPMTFKNVSPYVATVFPNLLSIPDTSVRMVEAKRTFWEKATILHKESYRVSSQFPRRQSRHYYDLYMLCKSDIKREALSDMALFKRVVEFNLKFYPQGFANFESANQNGLVLVPSESIIDKLKEDYRSMESMFFGDIVSFDEILLELSRLIEDIRHI